MTKKTTSSGNGKKIVIVESPGKIKTISQFLGKEFLILSTFGHIKDLPKNRVGVVLDKEKNNIELEYEVIKDKEKTIADICKKAAGADEIYLASDPDREGELIAWHTGQEVEKVMKNSTPVFRISFNEITKKAVLEAISNKRTVDNYKVAAQQARRVLDRLVGYEVSPILWRKIKRGLSAGRVQSAALLLVCKREEEIVNFKPEESWSIHALLILEKGKFLSADLAKIGKKTGILKTEEAANAVLKELSLHKELIVEDIVDKKRTKQSPPPFITSTLQQEAYNKLSFTVERTMRIAQRLYEGIPLDSTAPKALTTYMRTDSMRIADSAIEEARTFIGQKFGSSYVPQKAHSYAKKGAQDAHEALRPIDVEVTPEFVRKYASQEEADLYELIWKRFVACQMASALFFQRTVHLKQGEYLFKTTGSTLLFDGFLKLYTPSEEEEEKEENKLLPDDLKKGSAFPVSSYEKKHHVTQPPPRYTEATLVKEMEKQGIGRPSTYVSVMTTIQERSYVIREKKKFIPTELGKAVNQMLTEHLPDIVSVSFTAHMEESLDKIAQGSLERNGMLFEFYDKFKKDISVFSAHKGEGTKAVATSLECPTCGKHLMVRFGKAGEFLGCSGYPTCTFTAPIARNEKGEVILGEQEALAKPLLITDKTCALCQKPLVQKRGRYGPFLACSGYPDCSFIYKEKSDYKCPLCDKELARKRWKKGFFWGCSGYPDCTFATFGEIVSTPCPLCSRSFTVKLKEKGGQEVIACTDKECPFKENAD